MQIEVLGERYQLQDPIGRGGMATIYRGRDLRMDRVVAIKVLREVYSTDAKFVARFQQEAKAASALQHPNIVQVYDYGQTDGNYYIVMELIEGTDLRRYLRGRGVLDVDRSVIIAHDVALGLGAAHRRGIVHRDVKPQNILVGRDGSIKLTDFGIASVYKDINAERLTTTGMTLGTVQYYAPEQAQGEIVSPAADVYALGIVMYEMLTGRTPFDGDNPVAVAMQHIQDPPTPPRQLNSNIPPALEEIILRCLEKVPEMRFRDGSQLARALETLGDIETDETIAGTTTPGQGPAPITYSHIPPRPNSSGRGAAGGTPQRGSTSSPDNLLNGNASRSQNGASAVADERTIQVDPSKHPISPIAVPESGTTRPFQRGTVPRSGAVQQGDSHFAAIITVFILLATLLLLGFSVFLAGRLGFLPIFNDNSTATPTTSVATASVPNLYGDTFEQARLAAQKAGFKLQLKADSPKTGVVIGQSPPKDIPYPLNSTIEVTLGQIPAETATKPPVTGTTTVTPGASPAPSPTAKPNPSPSPTITPTPTTTPSPTITPTPTTTPTPTSTPPTPKPSPAPHSTSSTPSPSLVPSPTPPY